MDTEALRSYVDRSRELVESSPELSERNTQIRLVQPFLTALGWELHQISADHRIPTADGPAVVDFALLIDDEPAVLVETAACAAPLERDSAALLGRTLLDADVDWGLLTNGRAFAFVAANGGELDRFECKLEQLPENVTDVSRYSREAAEDRRAESLCERRDAAAALAAERDDAVDDLTERLVDAADGAAGTRLRAETERFVDELIESLRGDDDVVGTDSDAGGAQRADADVAQRADAEAESVVDDDAATGGDAATDDDAETTPARAADAGVDDGQVVGPDAGAAIRPGDRDDIPASEASRGSSQAKRSDGVPPDALGAAVAEDGQYVVRFFGGRTSVWAVGHARAAMTTAQAVEYLLQRGAADGADSPGEPAGALSTPWGPDGDHAVLREEAVAHATIELSNGWHLDARVPLETGRAAVAALAERAGLRAMFQGEWSDGE